jgi:hypothetical protein
MCSTRRSNLEPEIFLAPCAILVEAQGTKRHVLYLSVRAKFLHLAGGRDTPHFWGSAQTFYVVFIQARQKCGVSQADASVAGSLLLFTQHEVPLPCNIPNYIVLPITAPVSTSLVIKQNESLCSRRAMYNDALRELERREQAFRGQASA